MSSKSASYTMTLCDKPGCSAHYNTVDGSHDRDDVEHWGKVNIRDDIYHHDVIGDQNGWNNYDLCPPHYRVITDLLGITEPEQQRAPVILPARYNTPDQALAGLLRHHGVKVEFKPEGAP